jgi:hypothetical protein
VVTSNSRRPTDERLDLIRTARRREMPTFVRVVRGEWSARRPCARPSGPPDSSNGIREAMQPKQYPSVTGEPTPKLSLSDSRLPGDLTFGEARACIRLALQPGMSVRRLAREARLTRSAAAGLLQWAPTFESAPRVSSEAFAGMLARVGAKP